VKKKIKLPAGKVSHAVYKKYFERETVTAREMAFLICGVDPENRKKTVRSTSPEYKRYYQAIRDAAKRGDVGQYPIYSNTAIDSKALFKWAGEKYSWFKPQETGFAGSGKIKRHITGSGQLIAGGASVSGSACSWNPDDEKQSELVSHFTKAIEEMRIANAKTEKQLAEAEKQNRQRMQKQKNNLKQYRHKKQ